MTSKEALEKLLNDINEQGQVIATNHNLMVNFNVNLEMFTTTIENALKDLERLEALEQSNNILDRLSKNQHETIKNLTQENEKLKKENQELKDKIEGLLEVINVASKYVDF